MSESGLDTAEYVRRLGRVFTVFDGTQDSGHVSYGVESDGARLFVKTPGRPEPSPGGTTYAERVDILRRATQIHDDFEHPALVRLVDTVTTADGIAVVYEWFPGELLRTSRDRRDDPEQAHNRFIRLSRPAAVDALEQVIDLHVGLERRGWVVGDFYDGCLLYDFGTGQIRVMDFECYHRGDYRNDVGRLPGSSRFMAPEEFVRGATIDSRTTVFNLGRMLEIFLVEQDIPGLGTLLAAATAASPDDRPRDAGELHGQWCALTADGGRVRQAGQLGERPRRATT